MDGMVMVDHWKHQRVLLLDMSSHAEHFKNRIAQQCRVVQQQLTKVLLHELMKKHDQRKGR